jgi:hypothetical protein
LLIAAAATAILSLPTGCCCFAMLHAIDGAGLLLLLLLLGCRFVGPPQHTAVI